MEIGAWSGPGIPLTLTISSKCTPTEGVCGRQNGGKTISCSVHVLPFYITFSHHELHVLIRSCFVLRCLAYCQAAFTHVGDGVGIDITSRWTLCPAFIFPLVTIQPNLLEQLVKVATYLPLDGEKENIFLHIWRRRHVLCIGARLAKGPSYLCSVQPPSVQSCRPLARCRYLDNANV
jgi:hypothetical protein